MTKFLTYKLLLPVAGLLLLTGCEEQVVNKFDSDASLYFYWGSSNNKGIAQRDSVSYSFFLAGSKTIDTVWLDVRLNGFLSPQDRPITIVQANVRGVNAAQADRDYVDFKTPDLAAKTIIPANATSGSIPIVIIRNSMMDNDQFRLDLALAANDYFVEGIENDYEGQTFTIKMTAKASQPTTWNSTLNNGYTRVFGEWGEVKMRFIIDAIGYTDFDTDISGSEFLDFQYALNLRIREKLEEYLLTNFPLHEAGGTLVEFPQL